MAVLGDERMDQTGLDNPYRLVQVGKAIKSLITGPPIILCQFLKIQKNDSIKGGTLEVLGNERTD
jgi:hypothetical protein